MDIIAAYREAGTYRGAAEITGTTHKTVRRVIARHEAGGAGPGRAPRGHNYDGVAVLVAERVEKTAGRISAKRLLPTARAAGFTGSDRNFRRLVAAAKQDWRREHHRGRRPAVWSPAEHLVIDWGSLGGLHVFCAVLAWSRFRFVRFAADERAETTLGMLAECFDVLGGVPGKVLADRMGCLKGGVVANVVVPAGQYVRFAAHYGFRPDFCEAADPESKGIVENLVGYAKRDLMIPQAPFAGLAAANASAAAWCAEVNGAVHSEICAVPAERLVTGRELLGPLPSLRAATGRLAVRKVDRLSCVRFASARYSVPARLIGAEVRLRTDDGRLLVIMTGEGQVVAEHFLVPPGEASVRDEHYGGPRPPQPRRAVRPRTAAEKEFCALGPVAEAFITGAAAAGCTRLGAELAELNTLRAAHGEQPFLAAVDRAVAFGRWRAADVRSILAAGAGLPGAAPGPTLDYLASLGWIAAPENLCLVGPAGTGKSHVLVALGVAAVRAGRRVRYFTAADLADTLYRGLADNSVGKVIENLLRNDLLLVDEVGFAPLDDTGAQLLFRFVSAAYERRALGIASHWPFDQWGRFLPEHTTAVSLLDRLLHHANVVVTSGDSYRMRQALIRRRARGSAARARLSPMDVKLGVDTLCYHCLLEAGEISLEQVLTEAHELGADFVQINTYHVRQRELSYLTGLQAAAADLGLSLCCAGDFLGAARRGDQVTEGVRRVLDWAAQAEAMGSPYVRVASGFYRHELMDKPEVIRQEQAFVTEVLQKSVSELGAAPVRPVLENHSDFTADEYVQIVEAVGADAMGVFLDVINPITMLADPSAVVARLLPWAWAGHVKDYRFQSVFVEDLFHRRGWNVEYVYPGEGVADLNGLIGQIAADTRPGQYWLSVEGLTNYRGVADQKYRLAASFQLLRGILGHA